MPIYFFSCFKYKLRNIFYIFNKERIVFFLVMKRGVHAGHFFNAFDFRQGVHFIFSFAAVNDDLGEDGQDHEVVI